MTSSRSRGFPVSSAASAISCEPSVPDTWRQFRHNTGHLRGILRACTHAVGDQPLPSNQGEGEGQGEDEDYGGGSACFFRDGHRPDGVLGEEGEEAQVAVLVREDAGWRHLEERPEK